VAVADLAEAKRCLPLVQKPCMLAITVFFIILYKMDAALPNHFNATLTGFCFFLTAGSLNYMDICIGKIR
jgi:hypothetical protein